MGRPNLEELRTGVVLRDQQSGGPLNAFNRDLRIRHGQLGSWWERILGILSLIFVIVTLVNLVIRNL